MKYNKIEIIENTTPSMARFTFLLEFMFFTSTLVPKAEAKRKFFIVSDKHLTELNLFSVYHGFLSFEIDHYNDTEKKEDATPKKEIETFIKSILFIN